MRVEDLDGPRVIAGMEARQLDDLRWLGLDWDEGPDVGGPHAPYRQSERGARYQAALDHLAGDLVPEHQVGGGRRATADHVLVRAADVRGNRLEDDPVVDLPADVRGVDAGSVLELEGGVVDVDDLDLGRGINR